MSKATLTPGRRVLHRSLGLGTVESTPKPDAVLVRFDSGHTVMARSRDLRTSSDFTVAELAATGYKMGVYWVDLLRGLQEQRV